MPGMDGGVVESCSKSYSVLVLRHLFLTANNQLVPAFILKMLDCLAKVDLLVVN